MYVRHLATVKTFTSAWKKRHNKILLYILKWSNIDVYCFEEVLGHKKSLLENELGTGGRIYFYDVKTPIINFWYLQEIGFYWSSSCNDAVIETEYFIIMHEIFHSEGEGEEFLVCTFLKNRWQKLFVMCSLSALSLLLESSGTRPYPYFTHFQSSSAP